MYNVSCNIMYDFALWYTLSELDWIYSWSTEWQRICPYYLTISAMWRIVWRVFGACFGIKQRSLPLSGKKEGLALLADSEWLLVGRDSHLVHEKNSMFDTLLRHCQAQAGVSIFCMSSGSRSMKPYLYVIRNSYGLDFSIPFRKHHTLESLSSWPWLACGIAIYRHGFE